MLYNVLLHKADDVGYWVECPRLPGCISEGDTRKEALCNIREAISLYLEVVEKDNLWETLPEVVYLEI